MLSIDTANTVKHKIFLFTDASVNPQTNIGYGAYIFFKEDKLLFNASAYDIKTKKFENTSSTKIELETLLWSLSEIRPQSCEIIIYTDCQNIIGLKDRREKFEREKYMSRNNKFIRNHELYKEFFNITDLLTCQFVKVKGHKRKDIKSDIDKIFTLVDKASRTALRESLK